jgi:hypothetical protein
VDRCPGTNGIETRIAPYFLHFNTICEQFGIEVIQKHFLFDPYIEPILIASGAAPVNQID